MPLYECSKCGAIDNTALTNFWVDRLHLKKPPLCSECDPDIGKWHGKFQKLTLSQFQSKYKDNKVEYPIQKEQA